MTYKDKEKALAYARKYAKENREWYLSHNICPRCYTNELAEGHKLCGVCLHDRRLYSHIRYPQYAQRQAERRKERIAERLANGQCVKCADALPDDWRLQMCPECRRKNSEYRKIQYMKRKGVQAHYD